MHWIVQGLFERHKLIMGMQLCVAVLKKAGTLQQAKLEFLIRGARATTSVNTLRDWLPDSAWGAAQALKAGSSLAP